MNDQPFKRHRLLLVAVASLYIWALLMFEHINGGVVSHHLLQRGDLPAISNWWGALLVPLLSWVLTGFIYKRVGSFYPVGIVAGFGASVVFGIVLSILFQQQQHQLLSSMMMCLPVLGLLFALYRAEYLLGFVLAMSYCFGAVLPTIIGLLIVLMSFVLHKSLRPLLWYLWCWLSKRSGTLQ
ncbi:hypothetical protein EMM73_13445 [Rheinheimera sediminis]|uniref:hypothetical protein n=1 Tax=Rheinheimera sp. YQF-1 TaxID=2499626 RepID=UPI000FDA936F|nr:hypothetical protein [Rheinheimera sp. YQF-1]RVT45464.1 hypothetical protein EMM73_13445 [Rheinheimera sp. YQF-1]